MLTGDPNTVVWDGINIYNSEVVTSGTIRIYKRDLDDNVLASVDISVHLGQTYASLIERGDYLYCIKSDTTGIKGREFVCKIKKSDMNVTYLNLRYRFPSGYYAQPLGNHTTMAKGSSGFVLQCDNYSTNKQGAVFLSEDGSSMTVLTETWNQDAPPQVAYIESEEEFWVFQPYVDNTIYKYNLSGVYQGSESGIGGYTLGYNNIFRSPSGAIKELPDLTVQFPNTASWVTNGLMKAWEE